MFKELCLVGALAQAFELLASGRSPFADLPRRLADLETLEPLITTMAGKGDADIPVHAVLVPGTAR